MAQKISAMNKKLHFRTLSKTSKVERLKYIFLASNIRSVFRTLSKTSKMEGFCKNS